MIGWKYLLIKFIFEIRFIKSFFPRNTVVFTTLAMAGKIRSGDGSLLITKLRIPRVTSEFMVRPRITKIFRDGLDHKLTLVSATAGFGKTTSVSKWLGSIGNPAAWLTLDREDNDPNKFWRYLIAALSTIDPEIVGRAELIFCTNREASLERGIRYLINDIVFELEGERK